MWESAAGSEADAIRAEYGVGRDMAAVIQEQAPFDTDPEVQAFLGGIEQQLAQSVRNKLHRFRVTAVAEEHPTAFALPGGFHLRGAIAGGPVRQQPGRNGLRGGPRDGPCDPAPCHQPAAHADGPFGSGARRPRQRLARSLDSEGRPRVGWNAPILGSMSLKPTPLVPFSCARPASTRPARSACSNVSVDSTRRPITWGWALTSPPIPPSKTASNTCATALP